MITLPMKIEFISNPRHQPDTYRLCKNGQPITYNRGYFTLIVQMYYSHTTYQYIYRKYLYENTTIISSDEYVWMLDHPEECYMELML